jgi:hypothetical protein
MGLPFFLLALVVLRQRVEATTDQAYGGNRSKERTPETLRIFILG